MTGEDRFFLKLGKTLPTKTRGVLGVMTELKDFLSAKELAEVFEISIDTVLGWRDRGLPFYRIGKRVWFEQHEVAEFIMTRLRGNGIKRNSGQDHLKSP